MDIKLIRLLVVFFQRTNFIDMEKTTNELKDSFYHFKDAKIQKFDTPPMRVEEIPYFAISSKDNTYLLATYPNKVEFSLNGVFSDKYNDITGTFCASIKQFITILSTDENICGRLGFVNTSFIINKKPNELLKKSFLKQNLKDIENFDSISYMRRYDLIDNIQLNEINTLRQGHLQNKTSGVIVNKDINIIGIQNKLSQKAISLFIDKCLENATKEKMIKEITHV